MQADSGMALSSRNLSTEPYSGAMLQDHITPLLLGEGSGDPLADHAAHAAPGDVSPREGDGDSCAVLDDYASSMHGVVCSCIENVAAQAVVLCGHAAASAVWDAAVSAVCASEDALLRQGGAEAQRAALEAHTALRLAARACHALDGVAVTPVLGHAQALMQWVSRALKAAAAGDLPLRRIIAIAGAPCHAPAACVRGFRPWLALL